MHTATAQQSVGRTDRLVVVERPHHPASVGAGLAGHNGRQMGVDIVEMNHIGAEIAQQPPHRAGDAVVAEHAARGPEPTGKRAAEIDRRGPVAAPGRRQIGRMGAGEHRNLMAALRK